MNLPAINLLAILPEVILIVAAMVVLLLDIVVQEKRLLGWLSLIVVLGALAAILLIPPAGPAFADMALSDGMSQFLGAAILIAAALAIFLSIDRTAEITKWIGAYYALLLLATAGMNMMVLANDFITIFLGLEILSLALYVLVGFNRRDLRSGEAALKYFLLGAFASGFFLYGITLIFAASGTTNLTALGQALASGTSTSVVPGVPFLPLGMGLLIVGFGFKLALAPFHMWTPDVYQGAPTAMTAFMSVATKAAAFGALIRVLSVVPTAGQPWQMVLAVLAVLTMTIGNLAALRQASIKRMLAYSSIAQAGYVLTGLAAGNAAGIQGALYYLLAYTFMNIGAFAVVLAVQRRGEMDVSNESLTGLAGREPVLAGLMALFMFSLAGIPPLAGFFGKLYVFSATVQAGLTWLAVVAMLNSAVAAYYYLRVTVAMYMSEPAAEPVSGGVPTPATTQPARAARPAPARVATGERAPGERALAERGPGERGTEPPKPPAPLLPIRWPVWTALVITAIGTVLLGLWQWPWMQNITQAVATLAMK